MMRDLVIEMNSMIVKYDLNLRYSPELLFIFLNFVMRFFLLSRVSNLGLSPW
jgi:hypothetical protein